MTETTVLIEDKVSKTDNYKKHEKLEKHGRQNNQACILLSFPPPPWGGKKSKGLEMGKEIKGGKKRKKGNLGKI